MWRAASARFTLALLLGIAVSVGPQVSGAETGPAGPGPARYGIGGRWGKTFDPVSDLQFVQVIGLAMWDYDPIWRGWAPKSMKFKLEGSAGASTTRETRALISLGMVAHYELNCIATNRLTPYLEGGLALMYTDFQLRDPDPPHESQGSRINFNPIIGIGLDFNSKKAGRYFAAFRLSHLSNAGLESENRGVNSIVFQAGRFFDIGK